MKNLHISTVVTIIAFVSGIVFAFLGFWQAGNSNIAPVAILGIMLVSSVFFALAAVIALRRKSVPQRIIGLVATVAALYMIGFGIFSFSVLRIEMPEGFDDFQSPAIEITIEAPPDGQVQ